MTTATTLTTTVWVETNSRLHTTSPSTACTWQGLGLEVTEITDPESITVAEQDPRIVWAQ